MYRVTMECDGRAHLRTPETRNCVAAMVLPVSDAEDAAVAARTLKQSAEAAGWMTDRDESGEEWFNELTFCPDCWPEWQSVTAPLEPEEETVTALEDQEWRETQAAVLRAWESTGLVEPGWSVEYHGGDGAYRARFTLRRRVGPDTPRCYNLSEIEFTTYVMALADLAPHLAGPAGIKLADKSR